MAINSFTTWKTRSESPDQQIFYTEQNNNGITARLTSLFTGLPFAGATPTTAVVPASSISGAFAQSDGLSRLCLADMKYLTGITAGGGMLVLIDRLSHQGGLDATVTSAQTTNLPTAALTRYTNGVGVMMGIEIYTTVGVTATTITVSYTNDAGTAGQTSPATVFGGSNFREGQRLIPIPLALGDVGVRAVANVTVLASTTTAGNFGIVLFKPIAFLPIKSDITSSHFNALIQGANQLIKIENGACLHFCGINGGNSFGSMQGVMNLIDA